MRLMTWRAPSINPYLIVNEIDVELVVWRGARNAAEPDAAV